MSSDELAVFKSYAARVKSITHRHRRPLDPAIISLLQGANLFVLPQLVKVQIGVPSWNDLAVTWGLSPQLRHLALDLGFNKARTDANGWSNDNVAAEYLEQVAQVASLEQLDIRGLALGCGRINSTLMSMKSLRVLTLTTGKSLSATTLAAIVAFPQLAELEFHAGHIDVEQLADSLAIEGTALCFPVLQKLRVRAHPSLMELLLQKMSSDNLTSLFIEAEQPTESPSSWLTVFNLISTIATHTLEQLTFEHHIDLSSTNRSDPSGSNIQFTLAILRPLARLPYLQQFVLDTTVPPDLCDADVEEMAKWWPLIERLDLGGLLSAVDCHEQAWKSRASLGCLRSLARLCPKLESLVINLDIAVEVAGDGNRNAKASKAMQYSLRSLTMGVTSAPDPIQLSKYLRELFPALQEIDGVAAHEEEWRAVYAMLQEAQITH